MFVSCAKMYGPFRLGLYSKGCGYYVTDDFGDLVRSPIKGLTMMKMLGIYEEFE